MVSRPSLETATASDPDHFVEPLELGKRVKEIRLTKGWTLEEVSKRTGIARSTLSKIENDQVSPSFAIVQKLIGGLGMDLPQLFVEAQEHSMAGRRDITRSGEGEPHPTATYEHELLSYSISRKKMVPFKTIVRARNFSEFKEWVRHDGEEFLLVLSGSVVFYSEFYEPVELNEGDSVYYDATMGHIVVSLSPEDAQILWVVAR
ncbi:MAG: transcriptional regulator [Marinomonas sp.]|jgi:transcriptional regulator with XRE-family HTH domain|uniref:Helix-turn-helix domain-containing protein n=1 Tax=Marinomonas ostreistagni TaxID=359209 RepID=A0ABS0ZDU3_9GAMM|nr:MULTISPECIES: XRE family transcriptional regulator [Marinomonas]MAF16957.1 transcriptional regulator [Marinomonas sp.]MEC8081928.1 XRE family transcriptional regulator [Pseudomonadota bacterium]MBJ7551831.1 helix-turn-helix domain-containing protein [Marinomonas ostreistagni]MCC4275776.1 XRE family transcriptional regulator [Marinomonas communis]MEC8484873.1 XRE family transcriptional regulator [Pseudomonadota bacterium]